MSEDTATHILTRRQLEKALEQIGPDDSVIIAVFDPVDEDGEKSEGFSENEGEGASVPVQKPAGDDGDDYMECKIRDSAVTTAEDGSGKKALLLFVDQDADIDEMDDEEGGDDDKEAEPA